MAFAFRSTCCLFYVHTWHLLTVLPVVYFMSTQLYILYFLGNHYGTPKPSADSAARGEVIPGKKGIDKIY
jgi:hypothetical protein